MSSFSQESKRPFLQEKHDCYMENIPSLQVEVPDPETVKGNHDLLGTKLFLVAMYCKDHQCCWRLYVKPILVLHFGLNSLLLHHHRRKLSASTPTFWLTR